MPRSESTLLFIHRIFNNALLHSISFLIQGKVTEKVSENFFKKFESKKIFWKVNAFSQKKIMEVPLIAHWVSDIFGWISGCLFSTV